MHMKTLVLGITAVIALPALAEDVVDPSQLLTHEVYSFVKFRQTTDLEQFVFDPASIEAEWANAELTGQFAADMMVVDRSESSTSSDDVIQFDWRNKFGRHNGRTAHGTSMSVFSATDDAEISLASIENLDALHHSAEWTVSLYEESTYIGDLSAGDSTLAILQGLSYELVFSMGGTNTKSLETIVTWNIQLEYSHDDNGGGSSSTVPGFGGLALLGGLGVVRRRRRN